jgi:DNA replication regulator DPB11
MRSTEGNGGTFHQDLSKTCTHLVSASTKGGKYEYAVAWGIKVVAAAWIHDCVRKGGKFFN